VGLSDYKFYDTAAAADDIVLMMMMMMIVYDRQVSSQFWLN